MIPKSYAYFRGKLRTDFRILQHKASIGAGYSPVDTFAFSRENCESRIIHSQKCARPVLVRVVAVLCFPNSRFAQRGKSRIFANCAAFCAVNCAVVCALGGLTPVTTGITGVFRICEFANSRFKIANTPAFPGLQFANLLYRFCPQGCTLPEFFTILRIALFAVFHRDQFAV